MNKELEKFLIEMANLQHSQVKLLEEIVKLLKEGK